MLSYFKYVLDLVMCLDLVTYFAQVSQLRDALVLTLKRLSFSKKYNLIVLYMAVLSLTLADLVLCLKVSKHLPVWMCVGVCLVLVKDMALDFFFVG